jgi:hypothetical protein
MKLFEVLDSGHIDNVLRVLQSQADAQGSTVSISFDALKNMANTDNLGISTPDALIQWKNKFDKDNKVIKAIEPDKNGKYIVFVNTTNQAEVPDTLKNKPETPKLDKMASRAADKAISSKI